MAWQLVDEVLHHAPTKLTAGERLVLVAIANEVHQKDLSSRSCVSSVSHLAHMAGLTPASVTSALTRLRTAHGIDVRVALSAHGGARGGPLYTVSGRLPMFRIPPLLGDRECACAACGRRRGSARADPPIGGSALADDGSAVADGGSAVADEGSAVADPRIGEGRSLPGTGRPGFPDARAPDGPRAAGPAPDPLPPPLTPVARQARAEIAAILANRRRGDDAPAEVDRAS